ncbi:MAG: cation-translocating P-type ATPase [Patescibacteria group bacterium]
MLITELLKETKFKRLLLALAFIVPLEILSLFSIHLPAWIEYPLFVGLVFIFGRRVIARGLRSLSRLKFSNINLLMTIATIGAFYLGELEEAAIIIVLFAASETLEEFGVTRSRQALEDLVAKAPKTAQRKGEAEKTPIERIAVNDILMVRPGDAIPLDGIVVKGESLVDESAITGEPLPKNKFEGDAVFAGSFNSEGYFEMKVTKVSKDSTLAKIVDLTFQSAERKSQTAKFIERFARSYTPAVVALALLVTVIPVFFFSQPFTPWLTQSLTLLLIACPCALVISTPITIFSGLGNATRRGVLIKGGQFLEAMGNVRAVAFDKTRTLTKGAPAVSDVVSVNGYTKEELLACIAGAEAFSEHPIAKSIVESVKNISEKNHGYTNFKAVVGKGISGECLVCTDKHHCIGTLRFVMEEHTVDERIVGIVEQFERQGKTAIVVSDDKRVKGIVGVVDEVRNESGQTIRQLHALGVKAAMLTGDSAFVADYVAKQIGIDEVHAKLLPDEKVTQLSQLLKRYHTVAMVGDGVNDAPSLATASVGIAMAAIGSEVAVENADIALMNNNLTLIPFLISLGRKATATIKANVMSALGVKFMFLALALLGESNLALAIFADVGMTIVVVANGLRLFHFRPSFAEHP